MKVTIERPSLPTTNAPDEVFELLTAQCGNPVGFGTTRDTYGIPGHPDKVLKISKVPSNMTNWVEIVTYQVVTDKQYFGEIFTWSLSGKYLVMERLTDVEGRLSGLEVPVWWNDKKRENIGRSTTSGELKIRDYGMLSIHPGPLFKFP